MKTYQVNFTTKYTGWQAARDEYAVKLSKMGNEIVSSIPLIVKSDTLKPFDSTDHPLYGTVDFVAPVIWSVVELNYE